MYFHYKNNLEDKPKKQSSNLFRHLRVISYILFYPYYLLKFIYICLFKLDQKINP